MDSTLPIAKRTRSREAIMYKKIHEEIKKRKLDSGRTEAVAKSESSYYQVRSVKGENLGSGSVACKEVVDVEGVESLSGHDATFVCVEDSGEENKGNPQMGVKEGTDDEVIALDDSDSEDGVLFLGQECDLGVEECDEDVSVDVDEEEDDVFGGQGSGVSVDSSDELSSSSEEEDNDDPDYEDYGREKSETSDSVAESSSEDEGVIFLEERVFAKGASKGKVVEGKDGMEDLVDSENSKNNGISEEYNEFDNVNQSLNSVAKRTRSCFNSENSERKTKLRRTLSMDADKLESRRLVDNDNDKVSRSVKKTGPTKFFNRNHILKYNDVQKILLNSILGAEEIGSETSLSARSDGSDFDSESGIEESTPPDKTESEEEMDRLWNELNFGLTCSEIHSTYPAKVVEHGAKPSQEVEDETPQCSHGTHEFVIDEEVGILCKFCSFVKVEVKYISAPFFKRASGYSERKDSTIVDHSMLDDLRNNGSGFNSQAASDSSSQAEATVWDTIPGVKGSLYPHQREGFEFIWTNLAGGIKLDELKTQTSSMRGNGCIISHAPGTGKSRLTIVFLQSYVNLYPNCKPVIVAPRSMLLTWEEEFQKWKVDIPFHNLNNPELSGKEDAYALNVMNRAKVRRGERKRNLIRQVKLYSWNTKGSILGISYQLFARLVGIDKKGGEPCKEVDEDVRKILLDFPGLFVFDEGHTPRNHESGIFKALSKVKTEKRIILSGTPFQNNFEELYNILCLVAPKFADSTQSKVAKKRGRKPNEAKEKWASLTSSIGKVSSDGCQDEDKNLKELKTMIAPIVHIHKGTVLKESLPGLKHSLVVLQPDDFQKSLLEGVKRSYRQQSGGFQRSKSFLTLDHIVSVTSVHPSLLPEQCYEEEEFVVHKVKLEKLRLNAEAGIKTKFFMMLLKLSAAMNEKVLVFSQYIEPLTLIMDQLKCILNWIQGKEVLYMDGKRDLKERQSSIRVFNDPKSEAKVLLASTRACGEGINLVGASRVVLLDVTWNPAVERQAISRAYRLGQKKFVYVYHLITSGTMEESKCCRQARKERYSEMVFSSSDGSGNQQKSASEELEDRVLEEMLQHHKFVEEIIEQPEESKLIETFGLTKASINLE
ncbi:hypothetical protein Pint_15736 [Pistacia integerrima]|uniref:Uncharacterized protein n=1 Tax=Pistacia integerrima TaxID=434235 RepID=A0ACC0ZH11_9ROSI|nr:hypothetical protein Pint_15736 [Pistacia integerrima]